MPEAHSGPLPSFELVYKGHVEASEVEKLDNPRSRSAKLRAAVRTSAAAFAFDMTGMAVPQLRGGKH